MRCPRNPWNSARTPPVLQDAAATLSDAMTSPKSPRKRISAGWYVAGFLIAMITAAAAILLVWPQLLGWQRELPFTQIISFRLVMLIGVGVALIAGLALILVSRQTRALFGGMTVVLLVTALSLGGLLLSRGYNASVPPTGAADAVRVLTWNTLGNEPGSPTIAQLAIDYDVDVLMLPETTEDMGMEIAGLLREAGKPMWVLSHSGAPGYRAAETTLLVSAELGEYEVTEALGDTSVLATVVAVPKNGQGPTLVAAHPVAPVPEQMSHWRDDLKWLSTVCTGDAIVAGDFNATLDHLVGLEDSSVSGAVLGGCRDAALDAGSAALGTWTSGRPPALVPAIDHVMYTPTWKVTGFEVITREDRSGSDHRPVFAELTRA